MCLARWLSNGDLTAVEGGGMDGARFLLASVYLPYEATDPPGVVVAALVVSASVDGVPMLLGCDANTHHCQVRESVFNFITDQGLLISNRGNVAIFSNRIRERRS